MAILKDFNKKKFFVKLLRKIIPSIIFDYFIFRYKNGYKPSFSSPVTFNQHVFYIKYFVRDLRFKVLCDKYEVREYVENKIGVEYLIPLLFKTDDYKKVNFDVLESLFVMKPNDAAGMVYIHNDEDEPIDKKKITALVKKWLSQDYYLIGGEWQYKNLKKYILFETLILDNGSLPNDYKVHCFRDANGKLIQFLEVHIGRFDSHFQVFYDSDLNILDLTKQTEFSNYELQHIELIIKIFSLSRVLSEGFNYVRVDWYIADGNIYFGEMTFTPGNSISKFNPIDWDLKLGTFF